MSLLITNATVLTVRALSVIRKRAERFPGAGVEISEMVQLVANLTGMSTNCDQQGRPCGARPTSIGES